MTLKNNFLTIFLIISIIIFKTQAKEGISYINDLDENLKFQLFNSFCFDTVQDGKEAEISFHAIKGWEQENVTIAVYSDEDSSWGSVERDYYTTTCAQKISYAKLLVPIANAKEVLNYFIHQNTRPRFWYLALTSCYRSSNFKGVGIEIESKFHNPGNFFHRQFSKDEQSILEQHIGFIVVYAVLFVFCGFVIFRFLRSKAFRFIVIFYGISFVFYYFGIILTFIHLLVYGANGHGVPFLGIVGGFFRGAAECLLLLVILLIAGGWFITFQYVRQLPVLIIGMIGYIIVLFIMFVVSHTMSASFAANPYLYASVPGVILSILRVPLLIYFIILLITSYKNEENIKKLLFYRIFGPIYSLWFLVLPFTVFVSFLLAPWWRVKIIELINISLNTVSYTVLLFLLFFSVQNFTTVQEPVAETPLSYEDL